MRVRFWAILWDAEFPEIRRLPEEIILNMESDADVASEGADCLSDKFGYCVHGFEFEILAN